MKPLFTPSPAKSSAQILREFQVAESTEEWLSREVADYFAISGDEDTRLLGADEILENDSDAFDGFLDSQFDEHDLVSLTLRIRHGHSIHSPHVQVATFPRLPTPTSLLWLCSQECSVGDGVSMAHVFADGTEVTISSVWPFGMHEAVAMTSPRAEELLGQEGDDVDSPHDDEDPANSSRVWNIVYLAGALLLGVVGGLFWSRTQRGE